MNRNSRQQNSRDGYKKSLDYLIHYFHTHVPPISKGETFRSAMKYLIENPEIVPRFNDDDFFRTFHRKLIRAGFDEIKGLNRFYHYGWSTRDCNGVNIYFQEELEQAEREDIESYEV